MLLNYDKLNNSITDRRSFYEEYFDVMDIPQLEKDKRVQLAEDIDDIYDGLFDLIALMYSLDESMDRQYLYGYVETRLSDVSDGSEYLSEYSRISAENTVNTTLDHLDEEYYTSGDRSVFLAAEDAQTIANFEQYKKALNDGKTHKEWRAELTKATRKDHRDMHGTVIPIKEKFQFPDCEMLMPHDTVNGTMRQIANCRCSLKFYSKNHEKVVISEDNVIMSPRKEGDYIGKPIEKNDNQSVREWYVSNVSNIPNLIDKNASIYDQAKQAFEMRNKYKREARIAMSDIDTVEFLERERPVPTFEELVNKKMEKKHLSREQAIEDILRTSSKTNKGVNKEFGL